MSDLVARHCTPCEGGTDPLDEARARALLEQVGEWELDDSGKTIRRSFGFRNFHETMAFVNAVAWVAHREDHHPDMQVGYKRCVVEFSTHAIGGLSDNDFICAAKLDALLD